MSIFTGRTNCTAATVTVMIGYEGEPGFGRVASVSDGTGTHSYGYVPFNAGDAVYGDGGLRYVSTTGAGGFASATHPYTYDALGRTTGYASPVGTEVPVYGGIADRVTGTSIGGLATNL